jgi:prepilin-type N-terminal cleavage/methylation domain-containing protein
MINKGYIFMKKILNLKNTGGFTLVEMMISVVIFTVIIAIVMVLILTANTSYHTADARISSQEDLRKALRTMVHEISETNQFRITISGGDQITFQIPVLDISGGTFNGQTVDDRNNIIFGARLMNTTVADGYPGYSVRYVLLPNNDFSNSNRLVRRVLDGYPNGTQVGADRTIANMIRSITYTRSGKTLSIDIAAVRNNKFGRDILIETTIGVTMRN